MAHNGTAYQVSLPQHPYSNEAPAIDVPEMGKLLSLNGNEIAEGKSERRFNYYDKQMMNLAMNRIVRNGNAYKVMVAIVDRANSETGVAWMAISTLCEDTGLDRDKVKDALKYLEGIRKKAGVETIDEDAKVIDIDRSKGGHNGETHTYRPRWHFAAAHIRKMRLAKQERDEQRSRGRGVKSPPDGGRNHPGTGGEITPGRGVKSPLNPFEHPSDYIPMNAFSKETARHLTAPTGRPADASHCGGEEDQGPVHPFDPKAEARRLAASPLPAKGYVQQPVTDELFRMFADAFPNKVALERSKDAFCAAFLKDRVPVKDILDGVERQRIEILTADKPINATRWISEQRWIDYGPAPSHLKAEKAPKATVPRAVLEMAAERRAREAARAKDIRASMRDRVEEVDDEDEDDRRDRRQERREERRMDSDGYPMPPGAIIIPAAWVDDDAPF